MPRFAANLSWLFKEYPLLLRFAAAREAGFRAVEILFPYELPAPQIREMLEDNDLTLALINAPPPNYTERPRGFAAMPDRVEFFERDLTRALRTAEALGSERLHLMSGTAEGPEARTTMIRNLRHALEVAPEACFTIEPINTQTMPGYFLNSFDLAAEILDEIDSPRLGLQFDAFHAQMISGDALATYQAHAARITHIQIAQAPGRTAPTEGPVDFTALFSAVDAGGYDGWIAAEYDCQGATAASLGWLKDVA